MRDRSFLLLTWSAFAILVVLATVVLVGIPLAHAQTAAAASDPAGATAGHALTPPGATGEPGLWARFMPHPPAPRAHCLDMLAHEVGRRAYLEQRLDLTPTQRPLWDSLQTAARGQDDKLRAQCASLPAEAPAARPHPTLPERLTVTQKILAIRLERLQAEQPALEALYQALTPDQRAILDRPPHGGHPPHPM